MTSMNIELSDNDIIIIAMGIIGAITYLYAGKKALMVVFLITLILLVDV